MKRHGNSKRITSHITFMKSVIKKTMIFLNMVLAIIQSGKDGLSSVSGLKHLFSILPLAG